MCAILQAAVSSVSLALIAQEQPQFVLARSVQDVQASLTVNLIILIHSVIALPAAVRPVSQARRTPVILANKILTVLVLSLIAKLLEDTVLLV